MVYRMLMPTPPEDLQAIQLFLKNREETLVGTQKLWIGGPSRWGGRGIYAQIGRPYRVLAQNADGARCSYDLAAEDRDDLGNTKLQERRQGGWSPVIQ